MSVKAFQNQRVHMVRKRLVLKCRRDFGKERIADIGDDQPEQAAAAPHQIARGLILGIPELSRRRKHALAGMLARVARPVQNVRNGRN